MVVFVLVPNGSRQQVLDAGIAGVTLRELLQRAAAEAGGAPPLMREGNRVSGDDAWIVTSVPGEDVLLIDADVWLSKRALMDLVARGAVATRPIALIGDSTVTPPRGKDEDILALYVPAVAAPTKPRDAGSSSGSIAHVAEAIGEYDRVVSKVLDPAQSARRVVDLIDLAAVEAAVLYERACEAMRGGVRIRDPHRVSIRGNLRCAAGVTIDVDVIIEGDVTIENGATIGPYCILNDAHIGSQARVNAFSIVDSATVGAGSSVGPYGRLRPGTSLGEQVQIGNFVEIKNSTIGAASRINHLAFVGDATLGPRVTFGAGSITCNHDGIGVVRTTIEEGAYVGSGCELVAPIVIGKDATIGAGSTITSDAPPGGLTVARARQVSVSGWVPPQKKEPS